MSGRRPDHRTTNGSGDVAPLRILCLSHYYPPETGALSARMSETAEAWVRRGAQVCVVTCAPNYPKGRVFSGYRNALFQTERIRGVDVIRVGTFVARNEGFFLRTLGYASFALSAILQAHRLPEADVVFSTSPNLFAGVAGFAVARLKRRPWVLEIRDLWPESIAAVGAIKTRSLLAPFAALARFAYRKADLLVSVTHSFVSHLVEQGAPRDRIRVVRNGVDLSAFTVADGSAFRKEHGLIGKFVCSYVGTHGMAHRLETVLRAASLLRERRDIAILMVGDGAERERLLAMKDAMGLSNVAMLGQLQRAQMPAVMAATDASLVVLSRNPLFRSVIPSKIFEAMAMRRPIILGVEGESRDIVEGAGAGTGVEPENAEDLAAAIVKLADDPALCRTMGEAGRICVERDFDRERLAGRLLDDIEALAGMRAAAARIAPDMRIVQ